MLRQDGCKINNKGIITSENEGECTEGVLCLSSREHPSVVASGSDNSLPRPDLTHSRYLFLRNYKS